MLKSKTCVRASLASSTRNRRIKALFPLTSPSSILSPNSCVTARSWRANSCLLRLVHLILRCLEEAARILIAWKHGECKRIIGEVCVLVDRIEHIEAKTPIAAGTRSSSAWPPGSGRPTPCWRRGTSTCEDGDDVVVGVLETHGREATAARAAGLEILPRRTVDYRGSRLEEMDLPGILPRTPRGLPHRRARAHERAGRRARQALRGRRGRPRRRHPRRVDDERAAPRVAQRPRDRADRRARPRDGARTRSSRAPTTSSSSTSRPRNCSSACGPGASIRRSGSRPR